MWAQRDPYTALVGNKNYTPIVKTTVFSKIKNSYIMTPTQSILLKGVKLT